MKNKFELQYNKDDETETEYTEYDFDDDHSNSSVFDINLDTNYNNL